MMENKFQYKIGSYVPFLWFFALVRVKVSEFGDKYYLKTFCFLRKRSPDYVFEWLRKYMKKRNTEYRRRVAFLRPPPPRKINDV